MSEKKILVIEDEPRLRKNLVTLLKLEQFQMLEAENGKIGIELAKTQLPDMIICDVSMPEMNGHELLEALREEPTTARIPFIFLTAHGEREDIRTGMTLGADDYLTKPVGRQELLDAIEARFKRLAQQSAEAPRIEDAKPEALQSMGLTPREAEILYWVAQGKSNPDICTILDMQLATVKKHLENVFEKLGVENRTAASLCALEALGIRS